MFTGCCVTPPPLRSCFSLLCNTHWDTSTHVIMRFNQIYTFISPHCQLAPETITHHHWSVLYFCHHLTNSDYWGDWCQQPTHLVHRVHQADVEQRLYVKFIFSCCDQFWPAGVSMDYLRVQTTTESTLCLCCLSSVGLHCITQLCYTM